MNEPTLRFGLYLPNFGDYSDPRAVAALAQLAESAGWDGLFLWDHLLWETPSLQPVGDPWIILAAVAAVTERIIIGPLVTPLARRRPWKVAREAVSLDQLANGRTVFGIGLGWQPEKEFAGFGEDPDPRVRAEKLDEAMDVIAGLWSGEPFTHHGRHYTIEERTFVPTAVQSPRIPVWVAGYWPKPKPFNRAARWDGVFPNGTDWLATPDEVSEMAAYIAARRPDGLGAYDIVLAGQVEQLRPGGIENTLVRYRDAGLTWWLEAAPPAGSLDEFRKLVTAGPPRMEPTTRA